MNYKSKKSIFAFIILSLIALSTHAQTSIEGQWRDYEKGVTISIYEEDGKFFGQLVSSDDAEQNAKIQQKGKIILLKNFEKKGDKKYCCGTIYQPQYDRTLNATLFLENEDTLQIKAKYGIFSGTRLWKRL